MRTNDGTSWWTRRRARLITLVGLGLLVFTAAFPPLMVQDEHARSFATGDRGFLLRLQSGYLPDYARLSLELLIVLAVTVAALVANGLLVRRRSTDRDGLVRQLAGCVAPNPVDSASRPSDENDLTKQARAFLQSAQQPAGTQVQEGPAASHPLGPAAAAIAGATVAAMSCIVSWRILLVQGRASWRALTEPAAEVLPLATVAFLPVYLSLRYRRRLGRPRQPGLVWLATWGGMFIVHSANEQWLRAMTWPVLILSVVLALIIGSFTTRSTRLGGFARESRK